MKKSLILALTVIAVTLTSFAQNNPKSAGRIYAKAYADAIQVQGQPGTVASGSATFTFQPAQCFVRVGDHSIIAFATTAPVKIVDAVSANTETVTPSSVTATASQCSFSATTSNSHSSYYVTSGTGGLQEAINDNASVGGVIVLDPASAATTSNITSATGGSASLAIEDIRSGPVVNYAWNGSAYVALGGPGSLVTANGAAIVPFVNSENLTLNTGGTTTDTSGNLLPANSIILAVTGRVTTTISGGTCSGWQLGDATTAGRFSASDTTLTAGENVPKTSFPPVQLGTGVASATTGMYQAAAAKVRVTCATGAPGAGAVRITVFGYTVTNPAN